MGREIEQRGEDRQNMGRLVYQTRHLELPDWLCTRRVGTHRMTISSVSWQAGWSKNTGNRQGPSLNESYRTSELFGGTSYLVRCGERRLIRSANLSIKPFSNFLKAVSSHGI